MRRLLSACSLIGVFALASPACTPSSDAPPKGDAEQASAPKAAQGTFDTTWLMAIARDPAPVNALLASNPEQGWQLLYQQKYAEAVSAFSADAAPADAVGRARAELAMADLYDRAHRLTLEVLSKMEERLAENADRIVASPAMGYFKASRAFQRGAWPAAVESASAFIKAHGDHPLADAALAVRGAARLAQGDDGGKADLAKVKTPDGKAVAAALALPLGAQVELPGEDGLSLYGKRALVTALVEKGQLGDARRLEASLDHKAPDFTEQVGQGDDKGERKHYDPLLLRGMSELHARLAATALDGRTGPEALYLARAQQLLGEKVTAAPPAVADAPVTAELLPALAFGPVGTPGDLAAAYAPLAGGAAPGSLTARFLKELGPVSAESDQGKQVREAQDLGKAWEEALSEALKALPDGEGVAMVRGLQLPRGLMAHLLRARAVQLLDAGKDLEGLALLEYTFEKEQSSQITWINDPRLFLDTTHAYCRLDRYREALNYLYRLVDSYPQLWSVYEVLGNLSVLDTLDKTGVDGQ